MLPEEQKKITSLICDKKFEQAGDMYVSAMNDTISLEQKYTYFFKAIELYVRGECVEKFDQLYPSRIEHIINSGKTTKLFRLPHDRYELYVKKNKSPIEILECVNDVLNNVDHTTMATDLFKRDFLALKEKYEKLVVSSLSS